MTARSAPAHNIYYLRGVELLTNKKMTRLLLSMLLIFGLTQINAQTWAPAGAVCTQTTDVKEEINSLMSHDRKVIKMNEDWLRIANRRVCKSLSSDW